jgi:hypothetical protein
MRYKRLKDKIEGTYFSGKSSTATNTPSVPKNPSKATNKASAPRKRKASEVKDDFKDEEDESKPNLSQLDGQADETPTARQTRPKTSKIDLPALLFGDDDSSSASLAKDDSDSDFNLVKFDDSVDSDHSDKPTIKRVKKSPPSSPAVLALPLAPAPSAPPLGPMQVKKIPAKTLAPTTKTNVPPSVPIVPPRSVSKKPLAAIQSPVSPTPKPRVCIMKQSPVHPDNNIDIDIKRLKPGALLSFPQVVKVQKPRAEPERSSTIFLTASSISSSHDSAGRALKQILGHHISSLEVRPEDSVSNMGVRVADEDLVAPRGKSLTKYRPHCSLPC